MHRSIWFPKAKNGLLFFARLQNWSMYSLIKFTILRKKIKQNLWYNKIFVSGSDSKYLKISKIKGMISND